MDNLCRLCANVKTSGQLTCSITDELLNIEQKLIDCCRWKEFDTPENSDNLPQKICNACLKSLENCWEFAEHVAQAQHALREQIINVKPTILLNIESIEADSGNEYQNIEDIKESLSIEDTFVDETTEELENGISVFDVSNENSSDQASIEESPIEEDVNKRNNCKRRNMLSELLSDEGKNPDGTISQEKIFKLNLDDWSMIKLRCSVCKEIYDSYKELKTHFTKNHPTETIRNLCMLCDTSMSKRHSVGRHVIKYHRPYLKHCCKKCYVYFWDLHALQNHFNGQSCKNRPLISQLKYLCEICGKNFMDKAKLKFHTHLHLPIEQRRSFECYVCKSTFAYKKSLVHHMPMHRGEKIQHQCDVCLSKFSRPDALRRHSLIHLGQLPHLCEYCGKGFRTTFNLKVHNRIHTGERPYACSFCDYRSSNGPNLKKHIKQRHEHLM